VASDFDTVPPVASSLRQSTWTNPVVLAGLCFLFLWRSTALFHHDWLAEVPWLLLFILTGIIPQLFLLIYPLVTRRQTQPNRFHLPKIKCLLIEVLIAIPVVIGCILLDWIFQLAINKLSPGTSVVPEEFERMAQSTGTLYIYGLLLASFLYAPIAEEVFFRGFLFNAFRKRMPLTVAILLQSVIFGFGHFFGLAHAMVSVLYGLVLTLVYHYRKTIFAPIFVHIGLNGLMALAVFLSMYVNANSPVLGVGIQRSATKCVIDVVAPNSPAEYAGLLLGDEITQLDDYPITDYQSLVDTLFFYYKTGDSVVVTINREGEILQIKVVLAHGSSIWKP
jgi:membrane protease YdiL (CAAX protease family)